MKNVLKKGRWGRRGFGNIKFIGIVFLAIILTSCNRMNFEFTKRKYRQGNFVDLSSYKKEKKRIAEVNNGRFNNELKGIEQHFPVPINSIARMNLNVVTIKNDLPLIINQRKISIPIAIQKGKNNIGIVENYSSVENIKSNVEIIHKRDVYDQEKWTSWGLLILAILILMLIGLIYLLGPLLGIIVFVAFWLIVFYFTYKHHGV